MRPITRRRFLTQASVAAGTALVLPSVALGRRRSANEDIRIGVIGIRGRGNAHIDGFRKQDGVRVVALCDVDADVLARGIAKFDERGERVNGYNDLRHMLDADDIDVISIATPNHWHALATIWACQAGKDVYVEKPVSHNIFEGRKMVEAARTYGRIVQAGTQGRSSRAIIDAIAWMQAGNLGTIKLARGLCYKQRQSIGKVTQPTDVPDTIDYNLWTGPAPLGPLMRRNLHYDWHWVFDTGAGDLGNQGVHQMDICRWALGYDTLPENGISVGGRFGYDDDGNTPNTHVIYLDYKPAPIIFEVRGLPRDKAAQSDGWGKNMDRYKGMTIGVAIECENGYLAISSNYGKVIAYDNNDQPVKEWNGGGNHFANFIQGVRSRNRADLNADIQEGHLSAALCHIGNVSYRVGANANLETIQAAYESNPELAESFGRMNEHLAANGIRLDETYATSGVPLRINTAHERFIGNDHANALLTRPCRAPFIVPDKV